MAVEIRSIQPVKSELRRFVEFGIDLYKDNPYFVPPLVMDDVNTLLPEKNPAFDFCEAQSFMAWRDGKPVGRITGIINRVVNGRTGRNTVRFGFIDFIDDEEVSDALLDAVEEWGCSRGMTEIVGPMGFTDLDHEGMLTDGFDQVGTMATIYNYPYYPKHLERRGMDKDATWVEYRIKIPDEVPDRIARVARIVEQRLKLHVASFKSIRELVDKYGRPLFELINEAYDKLYGYSPLTDRQISHYIDQYLPMLKLREICVIVDENEELVGVGVSIPSFSRALQKSRGRIFPFGWWHLLKTFFGKNEVVDLLLVAVRPEYQSKGVNALLFTYLIPSFRAAGYKEAESNPELEDNSNVQNQWLYFEHRQHRRRSVFRRTIPNQNNQ